MAVVGPSRLILLRAGKFDYAEVELHGSLHLVGQNNVGKTSLVAALQFLYVDDQRSLHFSRPLPDSRRYYFPDHYSHILFECLTPTGFRVVGVHGLGPLRQHEFERFTYQGEYHRADFIDEANKPREPDAVKLRLADRGYLPLESNQLRAALTGAGDARGVVLGLVPLRQKNQYDHFRRVFQNLLRLAHLRQEDLKALLVEAHQSEFLRIELDLSTDYKTQYRRVTNERDSIAQLNQSEPDIAKALAAAARRDALRRELPVLWRRISDSHGAAKEAFTRCQLEGEAQHTVLQDERDRLGDELKDLQNERDENVTRRDVVQREILQLQKLRQEFEAFQPDWATAELRRLRGQADGLTHQIQSAAKAQHAQVERDLRGLRDQHRQLADRLSHVADLVGVHLRRRVSDEEIRAAFTLLNPELLGLPMRMEGDATATGGIIVTDEQQLVGHLRAFAARANHGRFDSEGVHIDTTCLEPPNLAVYTDPDELQRQLEDMKRKVAEHEALLNAIDQREQLEKQRQAIEHQVKALETKLERYMAWKGMDSISTLCAQREECDRLIEQIGKGQAMRTDRREEIVGELDQLKRQLDEAGRQERSLDERVHGLKPPPEAIADDMSLVSCEPEERLEALLARYETAQPEEAKLSGSVADLLGHVEGATRACYVGVDESATLLRLRQELDGLAERTRAVDDLWKGLIVQVRQALKRLVQDLDTLKVKLSELNRRLGSIAVSNLDRIHLDLMTDSNLVPALRKIIEGDELPLFMDKREMGSALDRIGELLQSRPRLSLLDLFRVEFTVIGADRVEKRYQQLDQIESNGTTITIKVLVNLMLLKSLLSDREIRIPFYLDEVANLDAANLSAILELARQMGFVAVLASPEARDVADAVYYLNDNKGRITLDPLRDRVRIEHHGRSD